MPDRRLTTLHGLPVVLPDARILGVVHDVVLDAKASACTHLFVVETPDEIVEGGLHVSIPWSWVRSVSDVVLLRWFPQPQYQDDQMCENSIRPEDRYYVKDDRGRPHP